MPTPTSMSTSDRLQDRKLTADDDSSSQNALEGSPSIGDS
jgi:hypothetical protein